MDLTPNNPSPQSGEAALPCPSLYFDGSATTPLCAGAAAGMRAAVRAFGNPSSLHHEGLSAEKLLREARERLLASLGGERGTRLIFTSGGTEANNLALFGTLARRSRGGRTRLILTDSEHPSVHNAALALAERGVDVIFLPTSGGVVDENRLYDALTPETVLLSVMAVNNETGAVYPIERLFRMAKQRVPGILTHTDAVQAFGKIPLRARDLGADLVTVSAHKIGGPKGVGALAVAEEVARRGALAPQILGGGQEGGLRSGTENTIGIAGFAGAAEEVFHHFSENAQRMAELRAYLIANLPRGAAPHLPPRAAPHILNIAVPGIKSETMLHFLSGRGICVSSGSACSSHGKGENRVLSAFGIPRDEADCSLRISLWEGNTLAEADALLAALDSGIRTLVRIRG